MAFHVMFLFIWLAKAMDYTDSLRQGQNCVGSYSQSRDEAKWLPHPLLDELLIDHGWIVCCFKTHTRNSILPTSI